MDLQKMIEATILSVALIYAMLVIYHQLIGCLLYTSPSPRD